MSAGVTPIFYPGSFPMLFVGSTKQSKTTKLNTADKHLVTKIDRRLGEDRVGTDRGGVWNAMKAAYPILMLITGVIGFLQKLPRKL